MMKRTRVPLCLVSVRPQVSGIQWDLTGSSCNPVFVLHSVSSILVPEFPFTFPFYGNTKFLDHVD